MDNKYALLIHKLNIELQQQPKQKFKRRFSKEFKDGVRELIASGLSINEVQKLVPISNYAIREWTQSPKVKNKNFTEHSFVKIPNKSYSENKFHCVVNHSSGFSIDVNDYHSLKIILQTLKSIG